MDATSWKRSRIARFAGVIAAGLIAGGFFMWNRDTKDADRQERTNQSFNAQSKDAGLNYNLRDETIDPDRTTSITLLIAGGFAALTALIVGASTRPDTRGDSVSDQLIKLNELHSSGAITTDEFIDAKIKLLRPAND